MKPNDGGPAFPSHGMMGEVVQEGMSLRDYVAAAALQGILASGAEPIINGFHLSHEKAAYVLADAMLAARSSRSPETRE